MARPHARYIIVPHEGVWKINLDNRYFGPFDSQEKAEEAAMATARKAADSGFPASVLLMRDGEFDMLWTNQADEN